jgi:hypothetical protein
MGLAGLVIVGPGCILTPDSGDEPSDTRIVNERNTVRGTILRQGEIWQKKRLTELEDILHPEFTFYIRDDDASDLPWVIDGFWYRNVELEIAANMFDPEFSGETQPVDTIEYTYRVLSDTPIAGGSLVTADADARVLVGPDTGWFSDTRFEFEVVPDPDQAGLFQIRLQREVRRPT